MKRKWSIQPSLADDTRAEFSDVPPLLLQLLVNRDITTPELIKEFLEPTYSQHIHDPFLFKDMQRAVERVKTAVERNELIVVYGDYDVDGISSTAVLFLTFRALGVRNVQVYIPDRYKEGYGLNEQAVRAFAAQGAKLLLCCDCGTSQVQEIATAKELGMDTIVVDHHQAPERLPDAYAFLNPSMPGETYPWRSLCATGVAWKLATALLRSLKYGEGRLAQPLPEGWEKWLLDLVALATIADMVPLLSENRTLVKSGLIVMRKGRRVGLRQLARVAGTPLQEVNSHTIGFQFAPRLNAAGRLKHAHTAYTLLTTNDEEAALQIARELHTTNQERQRMTEQMYTEALGQVSVEETPFLVVARGEGWSSGVVGLVAGKLKEKFYRPALAIGQEGGTIVGSGRSIHGFDITKALRESGDHLARFGGHPMACGFTVASTETLEPFLASMQKIAERELAEKELVPELIIDAVVELADVNRDLLALALRCSPFGIGASEPVFALMNVRLASFERVGAEGKHLRLEVADDDGHVLHAIAFRLGDLANELQREQRVDVAFHIDERFWNGRRELQMKVLDIRPAV